MNEEDIIDVLLEKDCYIIDVLPRTVEADSKGQFFDVEYYLLNSDKHFQIKDRFVSVILKLMCYCHIEICWNGWTDRPAPGLVEEAVSTIMANHSGTLNILFPDEDALMVFDWDSLNMSVYNPPKELQELMEKAALSEGLFWRRSY